MSNLTITEKQISQVLSDNIGEILKDVLTGYDSPVKRLFRDSDSEINKKLTEIAEKTFTSIINSPDFQESLKQKLLEVAVENMIKR